MMTAQIRTDIEIDAAPEQVWEVLEDFSAYPDWNPFIPEITGPVTEGARLQVRLQPPGGRGMSFRPRLLEVTPGRALRWLGHLGIPGLFDGEHRFRIEPIGPNRVRLVQEERFTGLLVPLILRFAERGTRQGFESMNAALKSRVERVASAAR
jgi:hypothetical protein